MDVIFDRLTGLFVNMGIWFDSAKVILARLFEAFAINCELFFVTLIFAIPLGLVVCFGSRSKFKPLAWLVKTFVWVIRGTPLMLQVIVIFFVPGLLRVNYGINIPAFRTSFPAILSPFVSNSLVCKVFAFFVFLYPFYARK